MKLSRRELLKLGLIGGGATMLPIGRAIGTVLNELDEIVESPFVPAFAVPLRIPPILAPVRTTATTDFYQITQRVADVQILSGPKTTIWGYNGITPGPTIRQNRKRDVVVRQINRLPVRISVHLHGGDVRPEDDGHPLDLVRPGNFKDYHYPGLHPPANLWYHDHAVEVTGRNVWMGLAAQYPIVSDEELALPLPKGRFEVPLTIQDRFFLRDNSIEYPFHHPEELEPFQQGVFGDVILVNGTPMPFFRVLRRKYRFRILNGSNARIYRLKLSTGGPFIAIASEGGFFPRPVELADFVLAPSERLGVIIDFSRYRVGTKVVLRNAFEELPGDPFEQNKTRNIMRFDVVDNASDPSRIPAELPTDPQPKEGDAVRTRNWVFARNGGVWTINEKPFNRDRIDARPRLGSVEIWRFVNQGGGWLHPIHPHLVHFQVLDRNGRPPRPEEGGPKDTVLLGPNDVVRVLMRFEHFKGRYVFHCHNLEHEDQDMMTQFEVV